MKFSERYPNGLNNTIASFQKALWKIMTGNEIENIINTSEKVGVYNPYYKTEEWEIEREWLKSYKEAFDEFREKNDVDWYSVPIWETLSVIESPMLFRDIITYMAISDKREPYREDDEERRDVE